MKKIGRLVYRILLFFDKLIIVPNDVDFTNDEIEKMIEFQEQYFEHIIIR